MQVSALWGQDTFDRVLGQLRQVYQAHPVSEALLVVAAPVLHVGSSLLRMARRKQREFKKAATPGDNAVESHTSVVPLHTRLARFSGVGMIWLFTLHATASRLGPVLQNLPKPDSRHLAGALSSTGMTIYMMVFSCMAVYHMSALMFQALGAFQKQLFGETRLRQWIRNALARDRKGIHPVSLGTTIVGKFSRYSACLEPGASRSSSPESLHSASHRLQPHDCFSARHGRQTFPGRSRSSAPPLRAPIEKSQLCCMAMYRNQTPILNELKV